MIIIKLIKKGTLIKQKVLEIKITYLINSDLETKEKKFTKFNTVNNYLKEYFKNKKKIRKVFYL